jgi:predicted TIM-barrel fold metal-dependent hydrolase
MLTPGSPNAGGINVAAAFCSGYFMNTRGGHKVLFASDHPVLSFERCMREASELPLRDGVLARYLRENALALFR